MVSQAGFHSYANWITQARNSAKQKQQFRSRDCFSSPLILCPEDFDVRKKGDHVESYNRITGESLYEAHNTTEAWNDIREMFGGGN